MQNAKQDGNSDNIHGVQHVLNFQLMFGQIRHSCVVCPLSDLCPACAEDNNSPSGDMLR